MASISTTSANGGKLLNDKQERDVERDTNGHETKVEHKPEGPDLDVVDWDGPDDPANPMNWCVKKTLTVKVGRSL